MTKTEISNLKTLVGRLVDAKSAHIEVATALIEAQRNYNNFIGDLLDKAEKAEIEPA